MYKYSYLPSQPAWTENYSYQTRHLQTKKCVSSARFSSLKWKSILMLDVDVADTIFAMGDTSPDDYSFC
jgi:hypothetical protein